jgi:hypothetical protein
MSPAGGKEKEKKEEKTSKKSRQIASQIAYSKFCQDTAEQRSETIRKSSPKRHSVSYCSLASRHTRCYFGDHLSLPKTRADCTFCKEKEKERDHLFLL